MAGKDANRWQAAAARRSTVWPALGGVWLLAAGLLLSGLARGDSLTAAVIRIGWLILAALVFATCARRHARLVRVLAEATEQCAWQTERLYREAAELRHALTRAETERNAHAKTAQRLVESHRAEKTRITHEIEETIGTILGACRETARRLEVNSRSLADLSGHTGIQAHEAGSRASGAARSAHLLARGVDELAGGIAALSADASRQSRIANNATRFSAIGGKLVATPVVVGAAGREFNTVTKDSTPLAIQASRAAGAIEADRSFKAVDTSITDLARAAKTMGWQIEQHRRAVRTMADQARIAASAMDNLASLNGTLEQAATTAGDTAKQLAAASSGLLAQLNALEDEALRLARQIRTG